MIFDLNDLPDDQVLQADLCIVGAGAAGIAMALQFVGQGLQVLLVESGGRRREADVQDLYAGEVVRPALHAEPDRFRCRQFGGSTTLWGGRCIPYDPIDFEKRSYIQDSGWPIEFEDLQTYYAEANRICEAGVFAYRIDEAFDRHMRPMIEDFDGSNYRTDQIERFSMPTNFAARYGSTLKAAENIRVVLHATATKFTFDSSARRLTQIEVTTLGGRRASIAARAFVLATGGLEVARLLLSNRDALPDGVGNQYDTVGRYYMCHIAGTLGRMRIERSSAAVWHDYDIADDGTFCRRRLALRPESQRKYGIGNFVARLHHPQISDPDHRSSILSLVFLGSRLLPWEYRTRIGSSSGTSLRQYARHAANVARSPFSAAAFAYRMVSGRFLAKRKIPSLVVKSDSNLFSLDFHAEQVPCRDSRVTLKEEVDALGMPRIKIDWRYTAKDVETVKTAIDLLAKDFRESGVGTFEYNPDDIETEMTRFGAYGGHHIGTARMGDDPRSSVVDRDCRVHSVDNLFVASAATFPTSSQANPTLTVVAMALRLADHLRKNVLAQKPDRP